MASAEPSERFSSAADGTGFPEPFHGKQLGLTKPWHGALLALGSLATLALFLFWIVISKLLPPTGSAVVEWMRDDEYYCLLVPITIVPICLLYQYLRWLMFMHFKLS